MTFLALDLGRRVCTAAVWSATGLVSAARADVAQDAGPREWWAAVEAAVGGLAADLVEVEAVGCSGASDVHVLLARDGEPLAVVPPRGNAVVADAAGGVEDVRQRTGVLLDAGALPARLAACDLGRAGWIASGRDFVASLLTGRLASDPTFAAATGFFTTGGELDAAVVAAAGIDAEWLPPQRGSTEVLGDLLLPAARRLGLRSRVPVVMGATSETCAVEGAGALPIAPLVTYGGSVVVAVPVEPPVPALPVGVALRAGGRSYQVYEAVLRGATETLDGLVLRTGRTREALAAAAAVAAPGADPLRLAYEAVAEDVARVVETLAPDARFLFGAGADDRAWRAVLPSVTGLPVAYRRSPEHATLGLAMLTATGYGAHLDRDEANPVAYVDEPDPDLAGRYAAAR
ncbi:MAG TPA: FGGY family carbohydrate kinase [Frankiaceae bacterium]|nr:FGGY family carbohydrate kinase [Frankiaceae bacterium]